MNPSSPHEQRPSYPQEPVTPGSGPARGRAYTNGTEAVASDYIDSGKNQIEYVLDLLYRGRWIILAVLLLVFTVTALYTYSLEKVYRSSSLVMVTKKTNTGMSAGFSFSSGQPFAQSGSSLANELLILRNSLVIARGVARRLQELQTVPETGAPISLLNAGEQELPVEQLAHRVQGHVQFSTAGQDVDAINITAFSTVPAEAALLANLYTEEYIELTRDASRTSLEASRRFLEKQQEQREQELEEVEDRLSRYMAQQGAFAIDQEGQNLVQQISNLEAQREEARIELQMREATLESLENELNQISPRLAERIASGVEKQIEGAQTRIAELELRKEQIVARSPELERENSPELQEINQQIRQLRSEVQRLSNEYVDEVLGTGGLTSNEGLSNVADLQRQIANTRIALAGLRAKINVMTDRIERSERELRNIPEQSIQLAQMQRARSYAERMYQFVMERLQEVRIREESEVGYADVIREALVPSNPVLPNTTRNLLAGLFGGLFLGIGLALARNVLDKRIYKPEDLREQGESVIAVVPNMQTVIKEEHEGEEYIEQGGRRFATSLVALFNPLSSASEAYRHLRTNIQFSLPDTVVQTILVTSPNMGEGKSVTAANLAVVMAQAGRKTLIVESDLRRPRVHRLFGLKREPGLVQRLFHENGEEESGNLETGIDNLYACTAGSEVPNPSEIVGSRSMREFVAAARKEFDIVIFDTPPVLVATDAALLATQCDATIVVAKAGETKKPELDQALKSLDHVGATVIGTILNGFDASMTYGYEYRYRYYSQDYYREEDRSSHKKRGWKKLLRS